MKNNNCRWNDLGNGKPEKSTQNTEGMGFTLENCKKACEYAPQPICDGITFDKTNGKCICCYNKMSNELI